MMKVDKNGLTKERDTPKYYQYRIDWVEVTPKMAKTYLSKQIRWIEATVIAKTINYSTESVHKVFRNKPKRVNKKIWTAITAYLNVKEQ